VKLAANLSGLILGGLCITAGGGCGSVEQSGQTPPPPTPEQPAHTLGFETRTDTVYTEQVSARHDGGSESRLPQIRFMVQIGAFKDPENANRIQEIARERYHLPVINDFNASHSLYQIRIGFFESRQDAHDFKKRMQNEHPMEYRDAWVVQLKR
jgi:cell division septation protein DedD